MQVFGYRVRQIKKHFRYQNWSVVVFVWFDCTGICYGNSIRFYFENYTKQCENSKEIVFELKSFWCTHSSSVFFRLFGSESVIGSFVFFCFVLFFFSVSSCCCGGSSKKSSETRMTRHICLINCCIKSDYVIAKPQSNWLLLAPWSHFGTRTRLLFSIMCVAVSA